MALSPTTLQVARLIYWRTRAKVNADEPGGSLVGDFTDTSTPTALQAQEYIDLASSSLVDVTGALAAAELAYPDELDQAITAAIAYQAAADIEASYPNTDADRYVWLQARADALKNDVRLATAQFIDTGETGPDGSTGAFYPIQPLTAHTLGVQADGAPFFTSGPRIFPGPGLPPLDPREGVVF